MTDGEDDRATLVAAISEGQTLDALHVMTLNATWQDVRPEVRPLRPMLRGMGIGHSFYKGELWFLPVDGSDTAACLKKLGGVLARPPGQPEVVEVDPSDNFQWNGVISRIARDAVAASLASAAKSNADLMARGSKVLDQSERIPGVTNDVHVLPGLDFHRVYRASHGRLLLACPIVFQAFDERGERPTKALATASCNKAYTHSADNRWAWVERTSKKLLPLGLVIGDRKFTLSRVGVPVGVKHRGAAWF